jgi:outer membrane protein assembly factor BamB
MLHQVRRPRWRTACLLASLALFGAFLTLAALVYFRDPAYTDAARMAYLRHADLPAHSAPTVGSTRPLTGPTHLLGQALGAQGLAPGVGPMAPAVQMLVAVRVVEADAPGGVSRHDWPQWRGPDRDGVSAATNLLARWPSDLLSRRKLWRRPAGDGYSAVAAAAGRAYTLMQDGADEAVVCWDAGDGRELWRFRYPSRFVNNQGSGPRSTPTVDGDVVYTVGATGLMHCLRTRPAGPRGQVVWRRDLLQDFGAGNLTWGVSFSPLVVGNRVYVNPGGPAGNSVAALDAATGKTVWHALNDKAGYSSPVFATLAGKPQVVFFTGEAAVGLAPEDGKVYWRFPWRTDYDVNAATPLVAGDYVFLTSGYGRGCVLLQIENEGPAQRASPVYRNRRLLRGQFSTPVRYGDHLYGFDESYLKCIDLRTGEERWRHEGLGKGSLLVADGKLIVLGEFGRLVLAEVTPEAYRELSAVQFSEEKCWTVPALADGRLYLRDPRRVVCLELRAGP